MVKIRLNRNSRQSIIVTLTLIGTMALFGLLSPYFLKSKNLVAILVAAVPLGLIGLSESLCLLTGSFDMSVGMVASLAGVISSTLVANFAVPVYASFAIGLLFGLFSGVIAGFSVGYLEMPAWISTYALMQLWKGVIYIFTNGEAIRLTKFKSFKFLGQHKIGGSVITPAVLILIAMYIVVYIFLQHTQFGRKLFITGGNEEAAKNVGVPYRFCKLFAFCLSGIFAAMAGILFASRSGSGQPVIGDMYAMQAIAASVIGGTSMNGGSTNPAMTLIGVLLIVCLQNGLNMISVPASYQYVVTGIVLISAILIQTRKNK